MLSERKYLARVTPVILSGLVALSMAVGSQRKQEQEEAADYYRKWLEEDVVYIITQEERDVFLKLQTDAERDRFIEEFWRRRDRDSTPSINEFKEEHYRRIQYANEHFTAGIPGWKTDRGRVYIKFGPPDDIQDYPAGSTYVRAGHEGGGTTLVNPFQVWRYNYIEGIGSEVEIEFVDPQGGNLYRFARDAQEKDMLLFLPLGFTQAEQLSGGDKSERIITRQLGDVDEGSDNLSGYTTRSRDMPMERLLLHRDLEAPPPINFNDLKKVVTTRIQYDAIPLELAQTCFRMDKDRGQVVLSVAVPDAHLTFQPAGTAASRASVDLYGMVSTVGNLTVYEFEDTLVRERRQDEPVSGRSVVTKSLSLNPGRYKLSLVVRDVNSGKMGTVEYALTVPAPETTLAVSDILLAQRITESTSEEPDGGVLLGGRYRVLPAPDRSFRQDTVISFYLELYGFAVDQSTSQPALDLKVRVLKDGRLLDGLDSLLQVSQFKADLAGDKVIMLGRIPAAGLSPGTYRLEVQAEDRIRTSQKVSSVDFRIDG